MMMDLEAPAAHGSADAAVAARVAVLDRARLRGEFARQDAFLYLDEFLPKDLAGRVADCARALVPEINRNYLPGHKQGGSVSRHTIDEKAPLIAELYRSKALVGFLETLTGDKLLPSPDDDPHAYALYYYTKPGDHIGWHYDTSYYDGRRYTLLFGVIDDSTSRLDYALHAQSGRAGRAGLGADRARRYRVLRRRQAAPPRDAARRERDPRVAHVRIRDRPGHAPVETLRVEHEGRDRVLRLPSGIQANGRSPLAALMTRTGMILLSLGTAAFVALLAWQGLGAVAATLASAGWGLALVAAFHLVPLVIDATAIAVMFRPGEPGSRLGEALRARWVGEAVNSLLPAGQIGGPVLMVRYLAQRGARLADAAAAITVSTTMQALAQMVFALVGIAAFSAYATHDAAAHLRTPALIATAVLGGCAALFYCAQRRGLFGRGLRAASTLLGPRDWSSLATRADAIDHALDRLYRERAKVRATFVLSFVGWIVGTAEVWLALRFLGHPVSWLDALLLESVGQAIRGAAFAIPGSLGAQEGGYLLLAPLVGLPPDAALALSLAKRARELALGLPGLLYLHFSERNWQRRRAPQPIAD